jgi:hypothetical protein
MTSGGCLLVIQDGPGIQDEGKHNGHADLGENVAQAAARSNENVESFFL